MVDFGFIIYVFTSLFLIVDPIANVPIFESILSGRKEKQKIKIVRQALLVACLVLLVLSVVGKSFFSLLGVQMYAFRVAGGVLLFIVSIEMLFGKKTQTEHGKEDRKLARELDDVVVTPLAIPLLTGPGAITTGIVLFDGAATIVDKVFVVACIPLVFLASWVILEFGEGFFKQIGPLATKVFTRVMGLMLAGIAVQFIAVGVSEGLTVLKVLA
jgi:multiple antibiotic resistance protein